MTKEFRVESTATDYVLWHGNSFPFRRDHGFNGRRILSNLQILDVSKTLAKMWLQTKSMIH